MADYLVPTIVLTPSGHLGANATYYSVAAEYPQAAPSLQDMLRFLLYPWAYQASRLVSGRQSVPQ